MGNTARALDLVVFEMQDVQVAINLVEEQKDPGLWIELIKKSLKFPQFVSGLLDHVGGGSFVDARLLIESIPCDIDIPDLKTKLLRIVSDYALEVRLRKGTEKILLSDLVSLLDQLVMDLRVSVESSPDDKCKGCENRLCGIGGDQEIALFYCGHKFHVSCLPNSGSGSFQCPICRSKNQIGKLGAKKRKKP